LNNLKTQRDILDTNMRQLLLLAEEKRPDVYETLSNLAVNKFLNEHKLSSAVVEEHRRSTQFENELKEKRYHVDQQMALRSSQGNKSGKYFKDAAQDSINLRLSDNFGGVIGPGVRDSQAESRNAMEESIHNIDESINSRDFGGNMTQGSLAFAKSFQEIKASETRKAKARYVTEDDM